MTTILSWQDADTDPIKYIEFDAVMLQEYTRSADVSSYPTETGATISDHVQPQQRAITLEVFVTDSPVRTHNTVLEGHQAVAGLPVGYEQPLDLTDYLRPYDATAERGATQVVAGLAGQRVIRGNVERAKQHTRRRSAQVLQFTDGVTRVVDVFAALDALLEERKALKIIFLEKEFANMYITNIRAPIAAPSGSGMTFTLDLIQILEASPEYREDKRKTRTPKKNADKRKEHGGHKATGPMSNDAYAELEAKSAPDNVLGGYFSDLTGDTTQGSVPWSPGMLGL